MEAIKGNVLKQYKVVERPDVRFLPVGARVRVSARRAKVRQTRRNEGFARETDLGEPYVADRENLSGSRAVPQGFLLRAAAALTSRARYTRRPTVPAETG